MNPAASSERFETEAGPIDARLASGLAKLALAARQGLRRTASSNGLSPLEAQILALLARRGPLAAGTIATDLGLTPPTVSGSLAALERKALVGRRRDLEDARRVRVRATRRGTELGRDLALWPEFLAEGVARLPGPEKETLLRAVVCLVRHLIARGFVQEARMCVTCAHFRPRVHADPERPNHCALADLPFGDRALRVDCPEQVPAEKHRAEEAARLLASAAR